MSESTKVFRWGSSEFKITDPETLKALEEDKRWWCWHKAMVDGGMSDDFENWVRNYHSQTLDEYKKYESETEPNVYYLGFTSWCWKNHRSICDEFMVQHDLYSN